MATTSETPWPSIEGTDDAHSSPNDSDGPSHQSQQRPAAAATPPLARLRARRAIRAPTRLTYPSAHLQTKPRRKKRPTEWQVSSIANSLHPDDLRFAERCRRRDLKEIHYAVRWEGDYDDSWEPRSLLLPDCEDLLLDFHRADSGKPGYEFFGDRVPAGPPKKPFEVKISRMSAPSFFTLSGQMGFSRSVAEDGDSSSRGSDGDV